MQNAKVLTKEMRKELLADYTATVSYCCHTGVKLVIGTEFQNTSLRGKFLKHEHPIFNLPLGKLLKVATKHFFTANPTEQYLLIAAILKTIKSSNTSDTYSVLDTTKFPLTLDELTITKLIPAFFSLLTAYDRVVTGNFTLPMLPTYRVTAELSSDGTAMISFVKRLTSLLDQASSYYNHTSRLADDLDDLKLDDELALELQLKAVLNSYSSTKHPKAYKSKLGKWAIKQLCLEAPHLSDDKIASISYYIQSDSLALDEDILQEYIKLLGDVLPMSDDCREQSLLVIQHLKSKLNSIYQELENYGFDLVEEEEELVGSRKATATSEGIAGIKLKTKKLAGSIGKPSAPVVPRQQQLQHGKGDALTRMMAKFGKAPKPAVVKKETV